MSACEQNEPTSISPELARELTHLSPEQSDKLLELMRGLFQCIGELNERLRQLEERDLD